MKSLKKLITAVALLITTNIAVAQDAPLPKAYTLSTPEDFTKNEKDVVNCINWLENSPINKAPDTRKEVNKFVLSWIMGSPNVTIEIKTEIVNFGSKNPDLLIIFMGGWAKLVIENPAYQKDMLKGYVAGLKSVIKVYKMGNGINKDKNVEKLIALDDKAELEKWVAKQMK